MGRSRWSENIFWKKKISSYMISITAKVAKMAVVEHFISLFLLAFTKIACGRYCFQTIEIKKNCLTMTKMVVFL